MTNRFLKAIDAINGIKEHNQKLFTEELRREFFNKFCKLDGNKEIEPLLVLAFLLNNIYNS